MRTSTTELRVNGVLGSSATGLSEVRGYLRLASVGVKGFCRAGRGFCSDRLCCGPLRPFRTVSEGVFCEVRLSWGSGSSWVLRLLSIWARDGRPHRLEHALHGIFPA